MRRPPANSRHAVRGLLLVLAALAPASLGACGGSDQAPAGATTAPTASAPSTAPTASAPSTAPTADTTSQATRKVTLYFADSDARGLAEQTRSVATGGSPLRAALVELAKGPGDPALQPALPAGTTIVGTLVRDGEALVNLSGEFLAGYPSGGAAAEFAVLAPLVYTATAIDGVERVRITVDGRPPAPPGSQYDWTGAFARDDFPDAVGAVP